MAASNTPLNSLADVRKRIDAYDKKTAGDYFVESTAPWIARNTIAEVGHNFAESSRIGSAYQAASSDLYRHVPKSIADWVSGKISYREIFNIHGDSIDKPANMTWKAFLTNKNIQQLIKKTVSDNFKEFKCTPVSPGKYLKHVVMQYNVANVVDELKDGRLLPAMAKSLGIGTLLYSVVTNTRRHYQNAKAQEDGSWASRIKTLGKTALGCVKEVVKSVTAWELGSIGSMIGSSLLCIGVVPRAIAGILCGGLLETGFKTLFNANDHLDDQPLGEYAWSQKQQYHPPKLLIEVPSLSQSHLDLTG